LTHMIKLHGGFCGQVSLKSVQKPCKLTAHRPCMPLDEEPNSIPVVVMRLVRVWLNARSRLKSSRQSFEPYFQFPPQINPLLIPFRYVFLVLVSVSFRELRSLMKLIKLRYNSNHGVRYHVFFVSWSMIRCSSWCTRVENWLIRAAFVHAQPRRFPKLMILCI
jgi:hypothetical protein